MVVEAVQRLGLESRVIIMSSDLALLREVKKVNPFLRLAAICTRWPAEFVEKTRETGASIAALNAGLVTAERVQAAHKAGLEVLCWTPNKPVQWARLIETGVDAIGTDDPAALIGYLKKRGQR